MYLDREVWLSTWLAPIPDENGKVTAVLGLSRDMTARKRAEDELRATEQRLRVVHVESAARALGEQSRRRRDVLRGTGAAGAGDDASGGCRPAVRKHRRRAVHRPWRRTSRRALAGESFKQPDRCAGSDVRSLVGARCATTSRTSPARPASSSTSPSAGGSRPSYSNAQKMEAIGRLAGGIAHDFNNNLTAIIGYVDMILGQIGDDKPISNDLKEVQRAAERSAGLVRRLLAFGRRQIDSTARTEPQQRHRRIEADARAAHRRIDSGRRSRSPPMCDPSWEMPVRSSRSS